MWVEYALVVSSHNECTFCLRVYACGCVLCDGTRLDEKQQQGGSMKGMSVFLVQTGFVFFVYTVLGFIENIVLK